MKSLFLALIRFYRVNISPNRPNCCRFIPSCSAYALEAVEKYGAIKGGWLTLKRLSKCHPCHFRKRGKAPEAFTYDPVP